MEEKEAETRRGVNIVVVVLIPAPMLSGHFPLRTFERLPHVPRKVRGFEDLCRNVIGLDLLIRAINLFFTGFDTHV
jgi:hypothetical protein